MARRSSRSNAKLFGRMGAVVLGAVFFAVACGGRAVETGSGDAQPGETGSDPSDATSSGATSKGSSGGSLPTHPLAECVPGFDRASNPTRACQWLLMKTEQCFDTFDAACACACPTSGNSVCSSSTPGGANSATPVFCNAT